MSDNHIQSGESFAVAAIAASMEAGALYGVGGYAGILATAVRGTGDAYNTSAVQGFPLSDGVGSGKGDLKLEGVYALAIADADQAAVAVGDPMFWDGSAEYVDATNTGDIVGHVWPQDDLSASRVLDSANDAQSVIDAGQTHVVYVKLFGRPKALA